jgi:hypothetical protein
MSSSKQIDNVYVYTVYLFTLGRGGSREGERSKRGEYRSQSFVENTNMTEGIQTIGLSPVYKL